MQCRCSFTWGGKRSANRLLRITSIITIIARHRLSSPGTALLPCLLLLPLPCSDACFCFLSSSSSHKATEARCQTERMVYCHRPKDAPFAMGRSHHQHDVSSALPIRFSGVRSYIRLCVLGLLSFPSLCLRTFDPSGVPFPIQVALHRSGASRILCIFYSSRKKCVHSKCPRMNVATSLDAQCWPIPFYFDTDNESNLEGKLG